MFAYLYRKLSVDKNNHYLTKRFNTNPKTC